MTPFEKQQIRTLVWKEWRQVRAVIGMGVGIIVLMLLTPLLGHIPLSDAFAMGTFLALIVTTFGLGVVPYGMELNDHTNAYLITRPVEHWKVFVVKFLWSVIPVLMLALICGSFDALRREITRFPDAGSPWLFLFAPVVVLAIQFFILLVPSMVPALILSISAGLITAWGITQAPILILVVLGILFVVGCYTLAARRMRGPGW